MAQARVEDIVAVFGGSGFLGREVVRALIGSGHSVCIAVRDPARARHIQGFDEPSRTNFVRADVTDEGSVSKALSGASTAVNVVAAYVEKGGITYSAIHEEGAKIVAQQAANAGLACLVHVSGIGSNPRSKSKYIRSRGKGEQLVEEAFPGAVIVRPSVMFGPNDAFLNTLDQVSRVLPALPAFGKGRTRLQPVFVEDVAAAIVQGSVLWPTVHPSSRIECGTKSGYFSRRWATTAYAAPSLYAPRCPLVETYRPPVSYKAPAATSSSVRSVK